MRIIKRSQLAMLSVAFMIMIAGYINYKYDPNREENLGQTVKVDGDKIYMYTTNNGVNVYEEAEVALGNKNDSMYKNKNDEQSLETFRISRDNMISELEDTYKNLVESVTASSETVNVYKEKLDELVKNKHLINIVEGILKAKGITDIVIIPTDDNYNVMVELDGDLTKAQVTMIQQIIEEEFKVPIEKIKIMQK